MARCRLSTCPEDARTSSMYCSIKCCSRYHQTNRVLSTYSVKQKQKRDKERNNTSLGKYNSHKNKAKTRGVGFKLTFDEWLSVWGNNLHKMGNLSGSLQMCRTSDTGAYEIGNVRLDTTANNQREAHNLRRKS